MWDKFVTGLIVGTGAVALIAILAFFYGLLIMWIINFVFSTAFIAFVFGASQIGFWKAYLFVFLCGLIFKSHSTAKE